MTEHLADRTSESSPRATHASQLSSGQRLVSSAKVREYIWAMITKAGIRNEADKRRLQVHIDYTGDGGGPVLRAAIKGMKAPKDPPQRISFDEYRELGEKR